MSYYLYTGGVLKRVEYESPDLFYAVNGRKSMWIDYVNSLPSIAVSNDLKKIWKEGDKPTEGKDFIIGNDPNMETGWPIAIPVNTLQEEKTDPEIVEAVKDFCNDMGKQEESQDELWNELYLMIDNWGSKSGSELKDRLKSNYHITRIKQ